jgi:hypothetical protein
MLRMVIIDVKTCVTCRNFRECWCDKLGMFICTMKGKECQEYQGG